MMFDHALVSSQFVPLFGCLVAFLVTLLLVWILLHFPFGVMPMPSLTDKDCHDVARLWGWKWVRQDNQDMKAKAVMRWTFALCGESNDVRFDNMKKFGPGKHKCSKTISTTRECERKRWSPIRHHVALPSTCGRIWM